MSGNPNTVPFSIGASVIRPLDTPVSLLGASTSPSGGRSPRGIAPNTWQWNVSVEQQLARNTALQVGYVGNVGIHQTSTYDINQMPESGFLTGSLLPSGGSTATFTLGPAGPQGAGNTCLAGGVLNSPNPGCNYPVQRINTLRPANNFGAINYFSRDGHSSYHSLQVQFRSKLSNFSTFNAAYTWSHTIADIEEDATNGGASQGSFTDIQNVRADRGNATINRPHIFVFNEVFFLPKLDHNGELLRQTAGGWEFNTIFTAESGNSITAYQNGIGENGTLVDPSVNPLVSSNNGVPTACILSSLTGTGYNNNNRPNIVPGTSCTSGVSGFEVFNPKAFTLNGFQLGSIGNEPRGYCHGPH
jgi:hypothetical protein